MLDTSYSSVQLLTDIAGGDYWIQIVEKYKAGLFNGYDAEKEFSKKYCDRLMKKYKYVLNMPIRFKKGQNPKYRMIHATNHMDGCILMFENITKRQRLLADIQLQGQQTLFDLDNEDEVIDLDKISDIFKVHMLNYSEFCDMNTIIADFLIKHGIMCGPEGIKDIITKSVRENVIIIKRTPPLTKNGKPTTFMSVNKDQRIELKSNR